MRVFLAGASGAIGRPLVPRLVAAGHEVTGMTRSEESAEQIRAAGAQAVVVDVFDRDALRGAVTECAAEVVLHELTALPERMSFRDKQLYSATNRVRGEGTRNLMEAARAAGARRFISQSVAFLYEPTGGLVKTEEDATMKDAPAPFGESMRILKQMERTVTSAEDLEGLVLRYGFFYGPGTHYAADGAYATDVRKRRLPIVGEGTGVTSFIHIDDAADATVATVSRGAPGVYNITDDEPAAMRDWVPVYAAAARAKPPRRVPVWLARLVAGRPVATFALELRGASNEKAKRELGWAPAHPSWRTGFAETLGAYP
jgi:nucleoside-diphosphate-sugar epimerase